MKDISISKGVQKKKKKSINRNNFPDTDVLEWTRRDAKITKTEPEDTEAIANKPV